MRYLAEVMNEINWNDRLSYWNHAYYFSNCVTGMVDTFPVFIQQPEKWETAKEFYNGKYKHTCVKFMMAVDFIGRIIYFDGSFFGAKYDGHLWIQNGKRFLNKELFLGDQHFSTCEQFITPYRAPNNANLGIFK